MGASFLDLISVILPPPERTALLRACLLDGDAGREAWQRWINEHGGPRTVISGARDGVKRLLPMLSEAQKRAGVEVEQIVLTCLRTAYLREDFRSRTYRAICNKAFAAFNEAQIPFIVLRGAALAETDYTDPALRHCHDCDLLIGDESLDRASTALDEWGFSVFRADEHQTILVHDTGLPIQLHRTLFRVPYYTPPLEDMWKRAVEARICDESVSVLESADSLLHTLGHASCAPSRRYLTWVVDAWVTLMAHPDLDWDRFGTTTLESGLGLPVLVMLEYLAESLSAPIPDDVLRRLRETSRTADTASCEAALFGVAAGSRRNVRHLREQAATWSHRAALLKWMFFPAPVHMRWAYDLDHAWQVPLYYAYRPLRALLRRANPWTGAAEAPPPLPEFMAPEQRKSA